ncbi:MAG: DUF962 domain-containing protein [Pseudomonadota bacterium]
MGTRYSSLREFYPFYLSEHADVNCRRLHFVGTTGVIAMIVLSIVQANPMWLLATPLMGYGFAWIGHFGFEKNRPATFQYPLYSLISDWIMYRDILIGRVSLVR